MVVKLFIEEGGEFTEIELRDSEFKRYTVLQLKTKIREKLTTRESSQELIYKGYLLRDDETLSHFGIKHKSTIHLETQPVTKTLFIKDNHGQTNTFFLDEEFKSYTVLQLKTKIREKLTTRVSSLELIFSWYQLEDAAKLSDYGIRHKSTIHLETQPVIKTLFIKDNHGQTNTFFLDEEFKSYTVLQLKTKIREKLTTRDSSQELIFKWCLLKDAAKLSDYGIKHESTIHFGTQPVTIHFIIKDHRGRRHTFCLDEDEFKSCRVEHLKRRLQDILTIPEDDERGLIYAGTRMDDGRFLTDYGIQNNSTIDLVLSLRGGGFRPEKEYGGMGDKGGKNRSMEHLYYF